MATAEDIRNWIHPALAEVRDNPDQPWEQRRARFLELLGVGHPDEHPVPAELLRRLDELPDHDREAVVGSDQVDELVATLAQVHAEAEPEGEPEGEGYDESAWQELLTADGPAWAGTADSWQPFREWFAHRATEHGLGVPATALLEHLAGLPVTERIAELARYGVVIGGSTDHDELGWVTDAQAAALVTTLGQDWRATLPGELAARWGPDWAAHPADHKTAWLADLVAADAFGTTTAPPTADPTAAAIADPTADPTVDQPPAVTEPAPAELAAVLDQFATLTDGIPGIEELSDEEITRIISETIEQTRTGD